jgi:hypothetical protein
VINNDGTESFIPNANIFAAALIPVVVLAAAMAVGMMRKKVRKE